MAQAQYFDDVLRFYQPDTLPAGKGKVHTVTYANHRGEKEYTCTYDKQGRKIKYVQYGIGQDVIEWTYRQDGSVEKYTHFEQAGKAIASEGLVWQREVIGPLDTGGRMIERYAMRSPNKLPDTLFIKCNAHGDTIYEEAHTNGKLLYTRIRKYDGNLQLVEIVEFNGRFTEVQRYDTLTKIVKRGVCTGDCKEIIWDPELTSIAVIMGFVLREEVINDGQHVTEIRYWLHDSVNPKMKFKRTFYYDYKTGLLTDKYLLMGEDTLQWDHFIYPMEGVKQSFHMDFWYQNSLGISIVRNDTVQKNGLTEVTRYQYVRADRVGIKEYLDSPEILTREWITGSDRTRNLITYQMRYNIYGGLSSTDTVYYDTQNRPIKIVKRSFTRSVDKDSSTCSMVWLTNYFNDGTGYFRTGNSDCNTGSNGSMRELFDVVSGKPLIRDSISGDTRNYDSLVYDSLHRLVYHYYLYVRGERISTTVDEFRYIGNRLTEVKTSDVDGDRKTWVMQQCIYVEGLPQKYVSTDSGGRNDTYCSWSYTYY